MRVAPEPVGRAGRTMAELALRLRKPLERSLRAGHPWLFRDAFEYVGRANDAPGQVARVLDARGKFVARGLTEAGPIGLRVFTTRDEPLGEQLLARRIEAALSLRQHIVKADTDAYRLLHGEGDRLPGIVCDRYGAFAVLRLDGAAAETLERSLIALLSRSLPSLGVRGLLVRTGRRQSLSVRSAFGPEPDAELVVHEHGMPLCVNLWHGQKTGLFLDHRESRWRVRSLATGKRVLNLYGYTGGFSVAAALGGATAVHTVDIAPEAIALAARSFDVAGLSDCEHTSAVADVPEELTRLAQAGRRFDVIVSDPPNFAPRHDAVKTAMRSYAALHGACLSLLSPGGLYLAASCSSHIDRTAFQQSLVDGARKQRTVLQVLEWAGAPADHPRLLAFPEGDYLKVALCRTLA